MKKLYESFKLLDYVTYVYFSERLDTDVHVMCIHWIQIQVYVLEFSEFDPTYQYFDTVRLRR